MHTIRQDIGGYDITNLCNQRTRKKQRRCGLSMVRRAVHPNIARNMCGHNFSGVYYFQNCFERNLSTLVGTLELYTNFAAIQFNIPIVHPYLFLYVQLSLPFYLIWSKSSKCEAWHDVMTIPLYYKISETHCQYI